MTFTLPERYEGLCQDLQLCYWLLTPVDKINLAWMSALLPIETILEDLVMINVETNYTPMTRKLQGGRLKSWISHMRADSFIHSVHDGLTQLGTIISST